MENNLILEHSEIKKNNLPRLHPTTCLILRKKNGSFQIINFGEVLPLSHQILFPYNYYYLLNINKISHYLELKLPTLKNNLKVNLSLQISYYISNPIEFLRNFIIDPNIAQMNQFIENILIPKFNATSSNLDITEYKKLESTFSQYLNIEFKNLLNNYGIIFVLDSLNFAIDSNLQSFMQYKKNLFDFRVKIPSSGKNCDFNIDLQSYIIIKDYGLFIELNYDKKSVENRIQKTVINFISNFSQHYNIDKKEELKEAILNNLSDHDFEYEGFETSGKPILLKGIYFDESTEQLIREKIVTGMDYFCNSSMYINSATQQYKFKVILNFTYIPTKDYPIEYKKEELDKKLLITLENKITNIGCKISIIDKEILQKELLSFCNKIKQEGLEECIMKDISCSINIDEEASNFISNHVFTNVKYNCDFKHSVSIQNNIGNFIITIIIGYNINLDNSANYLKKEYINKTIINIVTQGLNMFDGYYLVEQKNELSLKIESYIHSDNIKNQLFSQNIILDNIGFSLSLDDIALNHISKIELFSKYKQLLSNDNLSDLEILQLLEGNNVEQIQDRSISRKESSIRLNMEILEKFGDKLTNTNLNTMFGNIINNKSNDTLHLNSKNNDSLHIEEKKTIINGDLEE